MRQASPRADLHAEQPQPDGHRPSAGIDWHGLRFEPLATTFGIADPSPAQREQLTACGEHYRTNLPADMKIELYGNRVRIEPGAFGARAELINALGGSWPRPCPTTRTLW